MPISSVFFEKTTQIEQCGNPNQRYRIVDTDEIDPTDQRRGLHRIAALIERFKAFFNPSVP